MISYSPLSLEKICITKRLTLVWHDDFDMIDGIDFLLHDPIWNKKFRHRHEIMKWCILFEKNN